ncbi:MAG: polyprenyl synthetase family protein [Flavobacteriales bacterium]|nr:polyprenyl synthetase family protein [Flavobacteriales bacterium]
MSTSIARAQKLVDERIRGWCSSLPLSDLYAPMAYLMGLGGKRIRPVSLLLSCELFGGDMEQCLDEALGIELFHNFTLMHDDIMDEAPLRRGRSTVHEKWNVNTAILSGDAMLVKAYQAMGRDPEVLTLFGRYALKVCEGQQLDMEFEHRGSVGLHEHLEMIRLKTAVLLACAMRIGARLGGASPEDEQRMADFGEDLGLAFQLRDDLLDAFGDPRKVGKQRGGDLRAGKKTYLLISGLEKSLAHGRTELEVELRKMPAERNVERMIDVLEELGVAGEVAAVADRRHARALASLKEIHVPEDNKSALLELAARLLDREH